MILLTYFSLVLCESNGFNWNTWVPIFIALLALCYTIYDGTKSRKHDRLMVKPILDIEIKIEEKALTIAVKNCGFGPLRINSVDIYTSTQQMISENEFFENIKHGGLTNTEIITTSITDTNLMAGDENKFTIINYKSISITAFFKKLSEILHNTKYRIVYTDIYDKEFISEKVLKVRNEH